MCCTEERNRFISALNQYFGYQIQNTQQFKEDFAEEFNDSAQAKHLLDFINWYERKLLMKKE